MVRVAGGRAMLAVVCALLGACSYLPSQREAARVEAVLRTVDSVAETKIDCGGGLLAGDALCVEVVMNDGARIKFDRVGFNSLGSTAVNVFVSEAAGVVPLITSCEGTGSVNFHRQSPLGHHFQPTLIDLKDAVFRYREVLEEVQFWPRCPQFWQTQDARGQNYNYCARKRNATEEPPRPTCDAQ